MSVTAPASTAAVGQELVALCREGRNLDAVNKLYSPKSSASSRRAALHAHQDERH